MPSELLPNTAPTEPTDDATSPGGDEMRDDGGTGGGGSLPPPPTEPQPPPPPPAQPPTNPIRQDRILKVSVKAIDSVTRNPISGAEIWIEGPLPADVRTYFQEGLTQKVMSVDYATDDLPKFNIQVKKDGYKDLTGLVRVVGVYDTPPIVQGGGGGGGGGGIIDDPNDPGTETNTEIRAT